MCSYRHRHNDVQRTYILQHSHINHNAKPSKPSRIKSNPASKAAIQASVCVNRNQCQIRIEFDPATPASNTIIVITVSTASHVQFVIPICIPKTSGAGGSGCKTTRPRRCRCRCRTFNHNKCYQSVNSANITKLCCLDQHG
jgi:hypothetical protein